MKKNAWIPLTAAAVIVLLLGFLFFRTQSIDASFPCQAYSIDDPDTVVPVTVTWKGKLRPFGGKDMFTGTIDVAPLDWVQEGLQFVPAEGASTELSLREGGDIFYTADGAPHLSGIFLPVGRDFVLQVMGENGSEATVNVCFPEIRTPEEVEQLLLERNK